MNGWETRAIIGKLERNRIEGLIILHHKWTDKVTNDKGIKNSADRIENQASGT